MIKSLHKCNSVSVFLALSLSSALNTLVRHDRLSHFWTLADQHTGRDFKPKSRLHMTLAVWLDINTTTAINTLYET